MITGAEVIDERNFMSKMMMLHIEKALGLFFIPENCSDKSVKSLEGQAASLKEKFKDEKYKVYRRQHLFKNISHYNDVAKARAYLEGSHFDDVVELVGYDTEFIKRTFNFVQRAITLEKQIFDAVKLEDRRESNLLDRRQNPIHPYPDSRRTVNKRRKRI